MEQWEAEFCGFFWADGSIYAAIRNRPWKGSTYPQPSMRLSIDQRDDNPELIYWFNEQLGGNVYALKPRKTTGDHYQGRPMLRWYVESIDSIEQVLDILLDSIIPASKKRELAVFSEFVSIVRGRRDAHRKYAVQEIEQMRQLGLALQELKRYGGRQ